MSAEAQMGKAFEYQDVAFALTVYIAWVGGSTPARKVHVQMRRCISGEMSQ